jgi:ribosomal protein S18 acetylase RimI-like enzyme
MEDRIMRVGADNIETEHICCAIGNDTENRERAATKKTWLKSRFIEGLVFERLDARGKVFIEYAPIEAAWKPAVGEGWYVIHCLWVSGRFKGLGFAGRLLDGCLAEARAANRAGIAVVTSSTPKPFLTDKSFFTAHGFKVVDTAPPYFELLALALDPKAAPPRFSAAAARNERNGEKGFTFAYSKQCPFMEEYTATLAQIAAKNGYTTRLDLLQSRRDILERGSPFGTLGIYRDGAFVSHELMTAAKFETNYLR